MSGECEHAKVLKEHLQEVTKLAQALADGEARKKAAAIMKETVSALRGLVKPAEEGETTDEDREEESVKDGGASSAAAAAAASTTAGDVHRPSAGEQTQEFGNEDEESPVLQAKPPPSGAVPALDAGAKSSGGQEATLAYDDDDADAMAVEGGGEGVRSSGGAMGAQTMAYSDEEEDQDMGMEAKSNATTGAQTQAYGDNDDVEETEDESENAEGSQNDGKQVDAKGKEVANANERGASMEQKKFVDASREGGAAKGTAVGAGGASKSPAQGRNLPAWATTPTKGKDKSQAAKEKANASKGKSSAAAGATARGDSAKRGSASEPMDENEDDSEDEDIVVRGRRGARGASARRIAALETQDDSVQDAPAGTSGHGAGEESTGAWVPAGATACRYGISSNRQNPQHFREESHPAAHPKVTEYGIVERPGPVVTPIRADAGGSADLQNAPSSSQSVVYGESPSASLDQGQATLVYDGAKDNAPGVFPGSAVPTETLAYDQAGDGDCQPAGSEQTLAYDASATAGGAQGSSDQKSKAADAGVAASTLAYESVPDNDRIDGATLPYEAGGGVEGLGGATLPYDSAETGAGGVEDATMQYDAAGTEDKGDPSTDTATLDYTVSSTIGGKGMMGPPSAKSAKSSRGGKSAKGNGEKGASQQASKTSEKSAEIQDSTLQYDAMPSQGPSTDGGDATLAYDECQDVGAPATLAYDAAPEGVGAGNDVATLAYDDPSEAQAPKEKASAAPGGRGGRARGQGGKKEQKQPATGGADDDDEAVAGENPDGSVARAGRRGKAPPAAKATSTAKSAAAATAATAADAQASGSKRGRSGKTVRATTREDDVQESDAKVEEEQPAKKQKHGQARASRTTSSEVAGAASTVRRGARDQAKATSALADEEDEGSNSRVAIMISGITDKNLEAMIKGLQGSIETDPNTCTHLVTELFGKGKEQRVRVTAKMLAVLGMGGRPVVDRKWVEDSSKKGVWLPVDPFIIRDEQNSRFDFSGGTGASGGSGGRGGGGGRKRGDGGVFKSLSFFRAEEFEMGVEDCEMVIKAAGGDVVQLSSITATTIVLAGEKDFKKHGKSRKPPWSPATEVQKKDFIKISILNHKLDRKKFRW